MSKITWDNTGEKFFEAGVDHCVLYPSVDGAFNVGYAWNGITSISESPEGADAQDFYADNIKYGSLRGAENFGGTIECYTYPDAWKACDGRAELIPGVTIAQQNRKPFGLSYRSLIGNDTDALDYGEIIHIVYNSTASPSERSRETINESPEAQTMSYTFKSTPVSVTRIENAKATAHIEINSTKVTPEQYQAIKDVLYGTDAVYTKVANPTGNPKTSNYYELVNGAYVKSTDTEVVTGKNYYTLTSEGTEGRLPSPDELYDILTEV